MVTSKITRGIILTALITILIIALGGAAYFFHFKNLNRLEIYARYHSEIQSVKKFSDIVFIPWLFTTDQLPRYDLLVNRDDLDFLNSNLPPTYQGALLKEEHRQPVNGVFIANDQRYDVQVRYRGDTDVHWRDPQKSWRIEFLPGQLFNGVNEFNLIIPVDRYYLLDELNFYRAKKLGLAVPATRFVNLFVNNVRQGVYWELEHWGPSFLERNGVSTSTNLYGSVEFADLAAADSAGFSSVTAWRKYVSQPDRGDDYSDLQRLLDVINLTSDQEFNQRIGEVLDLENFYAWQISQYLTTSNHQSGINLRFYFDPASGKFKFIPWDILIAPPPPPYFEDDYNQLITRALSNPIFLHERNLKLWQYVGDQVNLDDDLAFYDELDAQTKGDFYKDSLKVESNFAYRKKVADIRVQLIDRIELLKNNLRNANAIVQLEPQPTRRLLMVNLLTNGFSAVMLDGVNITTGDCGSQWRITVDSNSNGIIDAGERTINFTCSNGVQQADLDWLVYSTKVIEEGFLKPGQNNQRFIISTTGSVNQEQIDFTIKNAVTGEVVEPTFN